MGSYIEEDRLRVFENRTK